MRTIVLVFSLIALAAPSHAAPGNQFKSRERCVDGEEVSRDGRQGAVRRRRAKPHWPVPSAALQRLHDGILISSPNVFRKAVDAEQTSGKRQR